MQQHIASHMAWRALQAGPLTRINLPRVEGSDAGAHRGYGFAQYTTVVSARRPAYWRLFATKAIAWLFTV